MITLLKHWRSNAIGKTNAELLLLTVMLKLQILWRFMWY